jgi:hypothetical protein
MRRYWSSSIAQDRSAFSEAVRFGFPIFVSRETAIPSTLFLLCMGLFSRKAIAAMGLLFHVKQARPEFPLPASSALG